MSDFDSIVEKYYEEIITEKPAEIYTENSFERKAVYTAIERVNEKLDWDMKCTRIKKYIDFYAKYPICTKHKTGLTGGCDCCSDPWCYGPNCADCGPYEYCDYAVDEGDLMYKGRVPVGLRLYYKPVKFKTKYLHGGNNVSLTV